ncbi:MAG: GIY-YIG nuclease family protein [Nanoarchaeota archaeon]
MIKKDWCVYIIECLDGTYYTGITNNLEKRMKAHINGRGSKYVKRKGYGKLLLVKTAGNRSEASKLEYKIKQVPKGEKLLLLETTTTNITKHQNSLNFVA